MVPLCNSGSAATLVGKVVCLELGTLPCHSIQTSKVMPISNSMEWHPGSYNQLKRTQNLAQIIHVADSIMKSWDTLLLLR